MDHLPYSSWIIRPIQLYHCVLYPPRGPQGRHFFKSWGRTIPVTASGPSTNTRVTKSRYIEDGGSPSVTATSRWPGMGQGSALGHLVAIDTLSRLAEQLSLTATTLHTALLCKQHIVNIRYPVLWALECAEFNYWAVCKEYKYIKHEILSDMTFDLLKKKGYVKKEKPVSSIRVRSLGSTFAYIGHCYLPLRSDDPVPFLLHHTKDNGPSGPNRLPRLDLALFRKTNLNGGCGPGGRLSHGLLEFHLLLSCHVRLGNSTPTSHLSQVLFQLEERDKTAAESQIKRQQSGEQRGLWL
ncbi:unnamed protein product [Nezara viridula]|uniref:Uncharacterized protein n=1 Tax=Nezara viridula TaxID=85310 RepID=A0A9P0E7T1_NEZVI|nr:unnamed protein product [Nezara viridula]